MIRPLTAADRGLFLTLCGEFYHSEAVLHPIPPLYHERTFQELMRSDVYLLGYLLEDAGAAAGYALLSRGFSPEVGGSILWLEELYLRPAFRGRGLGTEFFRYLETHHPASRYRLEVEPDNLRAKALYRRLGYVPLPYEQLVSDR